MAIKDIRQHKNDLRKQFREIRENLTPDEKRNKDEEIFHRIINSECYKNAQTIFAFVSTNLEVDTHRLIHFSLKNNKNVALPKCINQNGLMKFYFIKSMSDLEKGAFSLLEPNTKKCIAANNYEQSICIVPGFSFDGSGYRLGFGKGYYDRFLNKYTGHKIGVCYENCIHDKLPHGRYDVPVDMLITDENYRKITILKGEKYVR